MKEDEEASSFKLTTDCDPHHGAPVVGSVSKFFGSSSFSMGMVTWGHPCRVKTNLIGVKARTKRSKTPQITEKNHTQV